MTSKEAQWPLIVNLSNSIIGVSVLAMPFCMKECGILLGSLLMMGSNLLTRVTSHLLMKGAHMSRRRTYEFYALEAFGPIGKSIIEVMMVLFLFSTLCAFYVVIGDLGPNIVGHALSLDPNNSKLRIMVMTLIGLWVILPLSLLRNMESLSTISSMAIIFYGVFVVRMLLASLPALLGSDWIHQVNWWRPGGVLQSLPILTLSLSCQTQLFVTAETMVEPTPKKMNEVVSGAVNLCTSVYMLVGFFGYISFNESAITGDILVLMEWTPLTQLIKLCFMLSVAVSFPLMLFPCRSAIYTMLFRSGPPVPSDIQIEGIPELPFRAITFTLLSSALLIGIMVPNVELVLGLTGSLIGSSVCIIFPALLFLNVSSETQFYSRTAAQACLFIGAFMAIVCTYATLHGPESAHHLPVPIEKIAGMPSAGESNKLGDRNKKDVNKNDNEALPNKLIETNDKIGGAQPKEILKENPANVDSEKKSDGGGKMADGDGVKRKEPPLPQQPIEEKPSAGDSAKLPLLVADDAKSSNLQQEKADAQKPPLADSRKLVATDNQPIAGNRRAAGHDVEEEKRTARGKEGHRMEHRLSDDSNDVKKNPDEKSPAPPVPLPKLLSTAKSNNEVAEAKQLVKELKQQQKEQKELLEEQKELIKELKEERNKPLVAAVDQPMQFENNLDNPAATGVKEQPRPNIGDNPIVEKQKEKLKADGDREGDQDQDSL